MSARILIVDDVLASVKVLAAKLTGEYYEVLTATDGESALDLVREQEPDVVLLDVMMPGMDGYEVCRRLKQNPETTHIPIVMVTALSDAADKVRGLEAGADDFLTKPVSDTTLFTRVRSLVRLKRLLDQWRLREETTLKMGFLDDAAAQAVDHGANAHVTLVNDSPIENANIREVLSGDHDHLTVLDSFENASDLVCSVDPDVLIAGLAPANDDALRLCSLLRSVEQTRQLPILLIGEEDDVDRLIRALELGINDYITRPVDENELLARVRTQVRRKRYQDRLRSSFLHKLSLALTDSLTGLHNRRYLASHMEALMRRMAESRKPLSILMIDIDFFKAVNDTYGHSAGDEVLCEVAQRIARSVRGFDLAARYGGEEFVVVMPDTPLDIALTVADRLREKMARDAIALSDPAATVTVTVSIGVACSQGPEDSSNSVLKNADEALYRAKNEGRNRVVPKPVDGAAAALAADID